MEDPKLTKKIVRREVTRVLSPGTALDPRSARSATTSSPLCTPRQLHSPDDRVGLALLDLSTGEFRTTEFAGKSGSALCAR